jgi:hypothetical protein
MGRIRIEPQRTHDIAFTAKSLLSAGIHCAAPEQLHALSSTTVHDRARYLP